jgi:hypothetical protein
VDSNATLVDKVRYHLLDPSGQGVVKVKLSELPPDIGDLVQKVRNLHQTLRDRQSGAHVLAVTAATREPMFQHGATSRANTKTALALAKTAWKETSTRDHLPATEFGPLPQRGKKYVFELMVGHTLE